MSASESDSLAILSLLKEKLKTYIWYGEISDYLERHGYCVKCNNREERCPCVRCLQCGKKEGICVCHVGVGGCFQCDCSKEKKASRDTPN